MREIKFRAKTIRAGKWSKWIYGSLDFTKYTYQEARIVGYDDPVQYWHKIDKETIGQYIGLKDKNGKEIYEGDIVRVFAFGEYIKGYIKYNEEKGRFDVGWGNEIEIYKAGGFVGSCSCVNNDYDRLEVIGNIYDNPDLLKGE